MQYFVNGAPSGKDVGHGMARVELTERGDVGAVHVGIDQDHARTEPCQRDRQVDRDGSRADSPLAATENKLLRRRANRAAVARAGGSDECSELIGLVVHGGIQGSAGSFGRSASERSLWRSAVCVVSCRGAARSAF